MSDEEFKNMMLKENKKSYPDRIKILNSFFDFERWGFQQSYLDSIYSYVIYQSKCCRVRFHLQGVQGRAAVYYGRLHAPNEGHGVIVSQGEECWCWHDINTVLYFLEGFTPQELMSKWKHGERWTKVVQEFENSEFGKKLYPVPDVNPSFTYKCAQHSIIWKNYGQRLFDVFDLQKPELWQEYKDFRSEFGNLSSWHNFHDLPAFDKIC